MRVHVLNKSFLISLIIIFSIACMLTACKQEGAQQASGNAEGPAAAGFSLQGEFPLCQMDSIHIYTMDGLEFKKLLSAPMEKSGNKSTFRMSGQLPAQGFYMLGQAPNNLTYLILGNEQDVRITGNCMDLRTFTKVENSPVNDAYQQVSQQFTALQQQLRMAQQRLNAQGGANPQAAAEAKAVYEQVHKAQLQIVDSLKSSNPFLAKVFALNVFAQFDPANPQQYANSLEHFGGELFAHADLSDPAYDYIVVLTENLRVYTQTLFNESNQLPQEKAEAYLDALLNKLPEGSLARKNALAVVCDVLERMRSGAFVKYARNYLETYHPRPEIAETLQRRIAVIEDEAKEKARLAIGAVPPEIALPTPEGNILKLSDLKGKVVLLDFWASWCRPCRMENPNVVRVYQKYKNKGFEILSVSLDRDRNSWLQAIQQDNMSWYHVSDLKYWQSEAAKTYKISGIPATFLLDRDGRILAKNLRGPALEAKLAEVFGENS